MTTTLHDEVSEGVHVLTRYDADSDRWTTVVMGGPLDTWSTIYRAEADPAAQHAKAIEAVKGAADAV